MSKNFRTATDADGKKFMVCKVTRTKLTFEQAEVIAELFGMEAEEISSIQIDGQSATITHAVYEVTND